MAARVADERPARPVRLTDEVRQLGRAEDALLARARADALGELGKAVERGQQLLLGVGAHRLQLLDRPRDEDPEEPVVRREGEDDAPVA